MSTRLIGFNEAERWPTYLLDLAPGRSADCTAEVDEATIARWGAAIKAFDAVQDEMAAVYEEAKERRDREAKIAKASAEVEAAQARLDALRSES